MYGEAFWKRVIVFWVAFGLGVVVSSLFTSKESPKENNNPALISAPAENPAEKNCVPVDKNLRYETLPLREPTAPFAEKDLSVPEVEKLRPLVVPKNEEMKKLKGKPEKQKNEAKKDEKSVQPQFYNPSKTDAEYQTLLHKEKCYELDGRK